MPAGQFYLSSGWFVSFQPTQTTSVPEESYPPETFTRVQDGLSLPNPLEPLLSITSWGLYTQIQDTHIVT